MNIELLEKVKAAILAHPEHFKMSHWIDGGIRVKPGGEVKVKDCGTTACIAGWAVAIADGEVWDDEEVVARCGELLQLPGCVDVEEHKLLISLEWPDPFYAEYHEAIDEGDAPRAARVAAARIDHFILTEGRE